MNNLSSKSAFSLVELSISLLIISIIMAGIAGGIKMVTSARLANARSITATSPVPKIEGLIAWYETSRLQSFQPNESLDDGQITAWYDVSPGSIVNKKNTLIRNTPSTAVRYQLEGINKIPSIYFDGSGKISIADFYQGTTTQNTIFFVARPYALQANTGTVIDSGNGAITTTSISLVNNGIYANWGSAVSYTTTNCCSTNENYIVAFYGNGSSSKSYLNNATTMTGGANINPGSSDLQGLTIGADHNNLRNFTGLISEVIIYNRPLQAQERKDVMNYLSQKYGIKVIGI
ncbi:MAG: prepilin-type N-terminal cleavage/methylation domain-containing protein [Proteobacteria bacterium]|nr:prepilin-type N-terminal cleavage/methylation domain-containing protein [Pseudomonadota bacterium]